jgi:hypothetical protein
MKMLKYKIKLFFSRFKKNKSKDNDPFIYD